jgi:pyridoxal phosphate enzyme (YggS family)
MSGIAENLQVVKQRLLAAARQAARDPAAVRLVAVTKTVPLPRVEEAVAAGQRLFGENYFQEARPKIAALGPEVHWHFIGNLQSKKAAGAVALFDLIHSVDRLKLAVALEQAAARQGKVQPVLLQVNLAGEESKSGAAPEEVPGLLAELARLPHLEVRGLMTLPPWLPAEAVRPYFRSLRELRDRLQDHTGLPLPELSMGMTADFEVAVQEGATLIRVGTAIFGTRPRKPGPVAA